jgi:hypothetical protein
LKTNYEVEFIATPAQVNTLLADATLQPLLMSAIANGTKPTWEENLKATRYRFLAGGAEMVPNMALDALIAMGVIVLFSGSGIYIEVPTPTLDNLVTTSWPDAKHPGTVDDDDNVIDGDRRQYQDYTQTIEGENGTSLVRCGYIPNGMNGFIGYLPTQWKEGMLDTVDTPELIALYKAAFPDAQLVFYRSLDAWKAANVSQLID